MREEDYIARDLRHRTGYHAKRSGDLGDAVALSVPGQVGSCKPQFFCQECCHSQAFISKGGKRSRSATQLRNQCPLPALAQRAHLPCRKSQPARRLESEGDRQRLLQERAPHHERMPVLLCESRARRAHIEQSGHQEVDAIPHRKHQGGINRVLARSSPMYELLRVTLDLCGQHAYKRNGRGASHRRLAVQGRHIEQFHPATGRDHACRLRRDHPGASFRAGERGLERQHSPHMRFRGERGGHLRRVEQEVKWLRHVVLPFRWVSRGGSAPSGHAGRAAPRVPSRWEVGSVPRCPRSE